MPVDGQCWLGGPLWPEASASGLFEVARQDLLVETLAGCTHLLGPGLLIGQSSADEPATSTAQCDVTNLALALQAVRRVDGSLTVSNCDSLGSLEGLEELVDVGGNLAVVGSTLMHVNALAGLRSVGEDLLIFDNAELRNIDGLVGLEHVGGRVRVLGNTDRLCNDYVQGIPWQDVVAVPFSDDDTIEFDGDPECVDAFQRSGPAALCASSVSVSAVASADNATTDGLVVSWPEPTSDTGLVASVGIWIEGVERLGGGNDSDQLAVAFTGPTYNDSLPDPLVLVDTFRTAARSAPLDIVLSRCRSFNLTLRAYGVGGRASDGCSVVVDELLPPPVVDLSVVATYATQVVVAFAEPALPFPCGTSPMRAQLFVDGTPVDMSSSVEMHDLDDGGEFDRFQRTLTVAGLGVATTYGLELRHVGGVDVVSTALHVAVTTVAGSSPPPPQFDVALVRWDAMVVQWSRVSDRNSVVDRYVVTVVSLPSLGVVFSEEIDAAAAAAVEEAGIPLSAISRNLDPNARYAVSVTAVSAFGNGGISMEVRTATTTGYCRAGVDEGALIDYGVLSDDDVAHLDGCEVLAVRTLRIGRAGAACTATSLHDLRLAVVEGDFVVSDCSSMVDVSIPTLREVGGSMQLMRLVGDALRPSSAGLVSAWFPALEQVDGSLELSELGGLTSLNGTFPLLASVGGDLRVVSLLRLSSAVDSFSRLRTVGGSVVLHDALALRDLSRAFTALTTVGGELDVRGCRRLTGHVTLFSTLARYVECS